MSIIRIIYTAVIAFGYPVVIYQIRASLASWFHVDRLARHGNLKFMSLGIGAAFLTSLVAMFTPSILIIFDPFCSIFGAVLFQMMPIMIWYKLPQL